MAKGKWEWSEFNKLRTSKDLDDYLTGRQFEHSGYYHYTSRKNADNILSSKQFWLSSVKGFNDHLDKDQFDEPDACFSLCFSTGVHENLPMWYLYAGADGEGVRISLTPAAIRQAIKNGQYILCEKKLYQNNWILGEKITSLENGISMELSFQDVIYFKKANGKNLYDLKYNTMTNHDIPPVKMDQYSQAHVGFCKDLVWYYEKETRLLVKLKAPLLETINPKKEYVIVWSFDQNLLAHAKLLMAPDITKETLSGKIIMYPVIKKFAEMTSRVFINEYAGKVELSPCRRCTRVDLNGKSSDA